MLASGQFLTACAGLVTFAVLARVLTVRDYATYRQTILAYGFAAPLLMLGLPQALYYFLPAEKRRARGVLLENLLLLSLMGCTFSVFLLCGGNRLLAWRFSNPALEETLLIFALYPLFILPASALGACLMARDRVKQVAVFNVLSRLILMVIVLAATLVWRSPIAAIVGTVIGAVIVLLPALSLMLASTREGESRPTVSGMWSQVKYSVPLGLAGMIGTIAYALDKIIVASMCPPEQFAIYANGAIEIPLIGIITGSATAVLLPEITRQSKEGRSQEALKTWKRAAVKCSLIIYPLMCFLVVMAPEVMSCLFSRKYVASALAFRLYLALLPIRIVTWGAMFLAAGKSHLILAKVAVGFVLNLSLSVLFVSMVGYIGAVIGTIVTIYVWNISFNLVGVARLYGVRVREVLPYGDLLKVLSLSSAACLGLIPILLIKGTGEVSSLMLLAIAAPIYGSIVLCLIIRLGLLDKRSVLAVVRRIVAR